MIDLIKKYFEKQIELVKLDSIVIFANVTSSLASSLLMLILVILITLMFNISLAYWLGEVLESIALGFLSVGLIYTIIFIFYIYVSKDKVELKIKDQIVKSALDAGRKKNKQNESQ